MRRRIVQAAIGWTFAEMEKDMEAALREYDKAVGFRERIMVFDRAQVYTKDVDQLCARYDIGLIIFDQLRKVHGFASEAEHERQTLLFNWARERAKATAPVLNVTQAGAEAEGVRYFGMEAVYGAKTGPQSEADFIITMGRDYSTGNKRYINIPKNKLQTPGDPKQRNGRWEIEIDGDTASWIEPKALSK